jgi:hypothetical protein
LKTFTKRVPLALASAWRAPEGRVAIALGSIADEPLELSLNWSPEDYGLRGTETVVRLELESDPAPGGSRVTGPPLQWKLPPRGVCLLEFRE